MPIHQTKTVTDSAVATFITRLRSLIALNEHRVVISIIFLLSMLLLAVDGFAASSPGGTPPVVVDSIAPVELVQASVPQPDIQVFGSDFIEGLPSATNRPTVTLRHVDGIAEFSALAWINFAGTMATVTSEQMNLIVAPLGEYDVIVTRPDKQSDTLASAFTVTDGVDSDGPQLNVRSAWGGPVNDVAIVGDLAYAAIGRRLVVLDLSDEMNPVEIGSLYVPSGVGGVAVSGNYAFLGANKPYRFTVVDISDPTNPTLVGAGQGDSFSRDVHFYEDLVYVHSALGSVQAFDISSPTNVVPLGSFSLGGGRVDAMTIVGDRMYVVGGNTFSVLRIFDLTNDPLNPALLGSLTNTSLVELATGLDVEGDYAAWTVKNNDNTHTLHIVDITIPGSPTIVASEDDFVYTRDVVLSGSYAYVADATTNVSNQILNGWPLTKGLAIFDLADPANPTLAATFKTHGNVTGVEVVGNRAYLHDDGEGLIILDISNPANPVRLGNYHSPAVMRQMVKSGDILYIADAWNGFTVLDVSDAAHPQVVSVYLAEHVEALDVCAGTSYPLGVDAMGINLQDNKIYLAAGHLGLEVIDVADPANPTFLGAIRISELSPPSIPISSFIGVCVWNDVASIGFEHFTCTSGAAFFLNLNIGDPANIYEIGRGSMVWPAFSEIELDTNSGAAFLGLGSFASWSTDQTIDTSDPSNPQVMYVGQIPSVADVALDGNILYLASQDLGGGAGDPSQAGLYVQDVTDPLNPVQLAYINETTLLAEGVELNLAFAVAVQGDSLYVVGQGCSPGGGCGMQAIYYFDVSNPSAPVFLDAKPFIGAGNAGLHVDQSAVYVTNAGQRSGLVTLNIQDPNPADLDGDGVVGTSDLLILFANWGPCPPPGKGDCPADLDGDGTVNTSDLLELLANWG